MKSKFLNNPTTTTTTTTTTTSEASTSSSFSCIPENVCEISNGNSNLVILPVSRRRYSHGQSSLSDFTSLEIDSTPFDPIFNAAERFLKASLTAYTELLGIDKVGRFFIKKIKKKIDVLDGHG